MGVRRPVSVGVAACAVLAGWMLAQPQAGGAQGETTIASDGIVVVGDSITANYNDKQGDESQGWWSIVARHLHAEVETLAVSGTGYVNSGHRCAGGRFIDREGIFDRGRPALFIIEGGRNDWARCHRGRWIRASDALIAASIDAFFVRLLASVPDGSRIIILGPPWGPARVGEAARVTSLIAGKAAQYDLEFIDTSATLASSRRVLDGIHPNRAGSEAIAEVVLDAIAR